MHVLLIDQAFAGPDDPGGPRHYGLGRHLVANGHRLTVITSAVNYLTGAETGPTKTPPPPGMRVVRIAGSRDIHQNCRARARAFLTFAAGAVRAARPLDDVDIVWGTS